MLSAKAALLSVIIPVYNVEPYLEQCLDSVVNQTYKDLEIICINDGSTDNSLKILEKYHKKDSRIKLINQKNKGLSEARNAGLDIAKGEYIAFVDSDDYLELNAYEEAMKVMLNDRSVDLVEFKNRVFCGDNDNVSLQRKKNSISEKYFNAKRHTPSVLNKIFNANLLQSIKLRFLQGLIFEDQYFSHAYIMLKKNVYFLNMYLYNYRVHANSIIGKECKSQHNNRMHVYYNYDALIGFVKKYNIYAQNMYFIYDKYIDQIFNFCNDKNRLQHAVKHLDNKILNSDCPHELKLKYIEKRDAIIYTVEHPFEYACL